MSGEIKRNKDKSRIHQLKKRQQNIKTRKPQVRKICEKYTDEEKQVEKCLKLQKNSTDEIYHKQKQNELDFFYDPFSSIKLEKKVTKDTFDQESENGTDEFSHKSDPPSTRSNRSPDITHHASEYICHELEPVVKKIELLKASYDDSDLLYHPSNAIKSTFDEEMGVKFRKDEGSFVSNVAPFSHSSNEVLFINRLNESGLSDFTNKIYEFKSNKKFSDDEILRKISKKQFTPTIVQPLPISLKSTEKIMNEEKVLKIYVSHLKFNNHKHFTAEHVLANATEKLYEEYSRRKKLKITQTLRNKLENLREIKMNFPVEENKSSRTIKDEELALIHQIKKVREKLHAEEKYDQWIVVNLLESWKSLKSLRIKQSFTVTSTTLKIIKLETDLDQKKIKWQQKYDLELNEMIDEEFKLYRALKQQYKKLSKSDMPDKLRSPTKPDIDKIVANLNEIYEDLPVEATEFEVILAENELTGDSSVKHKKSSTKIKKKSYRFGLEIDGEMIGSTKYYKLDENFSLGIQSAFIVKLNKKKPQKIKLLIFGSKSINQRLGEIVIPLPEEGESFEEKNLQQLEFSCKRVRRSNSRSNFRLSQRKGSQKTSISSGTVFLSLGWCSDEKRKNSNGIGTENLKILKKHHFTRRVLKQWLNSNLINPLDPDAENLIKLVNQDVERQSSLQIQSPDVETNFFRFNEEKFSFCTEKEMNSIQRLNLLQARHKNQKIKNLIPMVERELEFEKDRDLNIIDESSVSDPIDLQRHRGRKYLRKAYETIKNHCDILNRDKLNINILIGDEPPAIGSLSLAFLEIFGPKRPLKPVRRATSSRISSKISDLKNFNIHVMVVRATNVPIRSEDQTRVSSRKSSSTLNAGSNKLTPFQSLNSYSHVFVTASFKDQHQIIRTSTAEGTNPMWNEQLILPLNLTTDGSTKMLSIDLYDEVVEDLIDNVTEIYQRISCKWLGSVRVPVSNIIANQRIEGFFEVSVPTVLLGYSKPKFSPSEFYNQAAASTETFPQMSLKTHLNLFISLEPNVEIPRLITSGLECIEVENVERQIKMWYEQLKLDFPVRASKWDPLVTILAGKRACVTRLLHPLKFPFEKRDDLIEPKLRRFVSLIPVQNDANTTNTSCAGLMGVWFSNTHVLGLMTSSNKDLGVLLTCYYLELGYAAWLILGSSLQCGECCFVLTRESNEYFITDPLSGKKYSCQDTLCPLSSCFCLVNQYNIWANIQRERRIFLMQFDVNRRFDWRPLFQKVVDIPNETVHDVNFTYERSFDVRELQEKIHAKIIKKINSWRSLRKTVWNRFVSENLKHILVKLEDDVCFENEVEDRVDMLKSLYVNYKITGYSINTKYTSLSSIVDEVKNTGIHLNLDNKVEFAANVHVRCYANNVLSVWILLVSLIPKQ